jgi:hypothetical protein
MYFNFNLILVLISIVLTIVILTFHYRGPNTKRMPKWMRQWLLGYLGRLFCIVTDLNHDLVENTKTNILEIKNSDLMIQTVNYYHVKKFKQVDLLKQSLEVALIRILNSFDPHMLQNKQLKFLVIKEIINCQRSLIEKSQSIDYVKIYDEWKILAMIIDRACFFLYLVSFLVSSIYFVFLIN